MTTTRFPTLLVLPATLWLAASLVRADENCSITRPGGVKEPGVTNIKGECCSSFYSNSGNWDDCVPPTPFDRVGRNICFRPEYAGYRECSIPPKMLIEKA